MGSPSRGADPDHEHRRLRPREVKEGTEKWIEDLFFGGSEVLVLSLPALTYLTTVTLRRSQVIFAALVALFTMAATVATLRGGWVELDPRWPPIGVGQIALRTVYYSALVTGIALAGGYLDVVVGSRLLKVGFPAGVALGATLALPRVSLAVRWLLRRAVAWHRYLFPPQY